MYSTELKLHWPPLGPPAPYLARGSRAMGATRDVCAVDPVRIIYAFPKPHDVFFISRPSLTLSGCYSRCCSQA
eukprot:4214176-Pyramimonas_sp.AAC.1